MPPIPANNPTTLSFRLEALEEPLSSDAESLVAFLNSPTLLEAVVVAMGALTNYHSSYRRDGARQVLAERLSLAFEVKGHPGLPRRDRGALR
jgi:hypothetical protein